MPTIGKPGNANVRIVPGDIEMRGGQTFNRTTVADMDYSPVAVDGDMIVAYTSITADRTVNLPAAATAGEGRVYIVKDESGSVGGPIEIIVDPDGAETIDGGADFQITVAYESVTIYCDGANWFVI